MGLMFEYDAVICLHGIGRVVWAIAYKQIQLSNTVSIFASMPPTCGDYENKAKCHTLEYKAPEIQLHTTEEWKC